MKQKLNVRLYLQYIQAFKIFQNQILFSKKKFAQKQLNGIRFKGEVRWQQRVKKALCHTKQFCIITNFIMSYFKKCNLNRYHGRPERLAIKML